MNVAERIAEFLSPRSGRDFASSTMRLLFATIVMGFISGCASTSQTGSQSGSDISTFASMYAAMPDERFPIPALSPGQVDPKFYRQQVKYRTDEKPGTIIVDVQQKFLFLVGENGTAMRYGIGVGRQGFSWEGRARIGRKKAWPTWTPPKEMIERQPELEQYANGMEPGLDNPLGARALYLFQGNKDTLYRLHGTNEVESIGKAVSSGCIRLLNQDIIDLYQRVPVDTEVVVILPAGLAGKQNLHDHGPQDDG